MPILICRSVRRRLQIHFVYQSEEAVLQRTVFFSIYTRLCCTTLVQFDPIPILVQSCIPIQITRIDKLSIQSIADKVSCKNLISFNESIGFSNRSTHTSKHKIAIFQLVLLVISRIDRCNNIIIKCSIIVYIGNSDIARSCWVIFNRCRLGTILALPQRYFIHSFVG